MLILKRLCLTLLLLYFRFQDNEFCLSKLMKKYPLKIKESKLTSQEIRQLHKLIDENMPLSGISIRMKRFESVIIDEIVILMRRGMLITKTHLENLVGATDELFNQIKSNVTDDDLTELNNIDHIRVKFSQNIEITGNMLVLVLNYLRVRQFLDSINVAYFDVGENRLVNGNVLLGSKAIDTNSEQIKKSDKSLEIGSSSSQGLLKYSYENSKQMECSKVTESVSSNQNGTTCHSSTHPKPGNSLMQVDNNDSEPKIESFAFKPLQTSQKTNQSNDIKPNIEVKSSVQVPSTQNNASGIVNNKRAAPKSTFKIQYLSDSDSDGKDDNDNDDKQPKQTKRTLSQWMTTKKPTSSNNNTNQSSAVPKRTFF